MGDHPGGIEMDVTDAKVGVHRHIDLVCAAPPSWRKSTAGGCAAPES